ncbi:MAG: class I SAM-dependent methyltransferase [Euryarchaeota archaeon]|nr:class I SAM-dependent methyltransferase [Euryarchaeota archaeon]
MSNVKFGADAWDARYSGDGWAYGQEPNRWLEERITPLTPGKALFPADGEGRNAVWAATMGWQAHVFDLSEVGKEKCTQLATEHNVSVSYDVDDLETRNFDTEEFDMIACSWFHVPWNMFTTHYPRMLGALKVGGHFITEGYHTSQLEMNSGGPKSSDLLWNLDEVMEVIGNGFEILHTDVETTILDESDLHRGKARVVRIHLVKLNT